MRDFTLKTIPVRKGNEIVFLWQTTSKWRVVTKPDAFDTLATCNTYEEALETAKYFLNRFELGYIS